MPDFASRSEATTSCALLPSEETIPSPVTATRLMAKTPSWSGAAARPALAGCCGGGAAGGEKADAQILHLEGRLAVDLDDAVADAEHELAHDHALEVDDIGDELVLGQHHVGELHLADAERPAAARRPHPAE